VGIVNSIAFNDMTHEEVMSAIKEGLHYLTTIDLVSLHAEISKVQIEHSHKNEIKKKND
jgi:hypothetical protein